MVSLAPIPDTPGSQHTPLRSAGGTPDAQVVAPADHDAGAGISIAEAAERCGLTAHTLRYYERDGLLLRAVGRASTGHRRYTEQDLGWITLITRLRATGMPIRDIRAYAALCRLGEGNETERLGLLLHHRDRVLAELAATTAHLSAINGKIGIYQDRLERQARRSV